MRPCFLGLLGGIVSAVVFGACADDSSPLSPTPGEPAWSNTAALRALERSGPARETLSATAIIGQDGGVVTVGNVSLEIPAGALDAETEITVTVPEGQWVQAHFAPHGLTFARPAELSFDIRGTVAEHNPVVRLNLRGVYFEDDLQRGLVIPREIVPLEVRGDLITLTIQHFSGYTPAGG